MKARGAVFGLSIALAWTVACGKEHPPSPAAGEGLGQGVAARIGDEVVSLDSVQRVAMAQNVSAKEARDRLIADALYAAEARSRFAESGLTSTAERVALSRGLLERLTREARAQGPPSEAEVAELTRERWWELDRPASSRTTHAVVIVERPEQEARAREVADAVAQAVRDVTSAETFLELARAVDARGLQIRAERLPPVTSDGRVVFQESSFIREGADRFDEEFARAANAIAEVGAQSPVTRTRFGFHVILLEERLAERRLSYEERRQLLADDVTARRARKLTDDVLRRMRATTAVEISRSAEDLTASIDVRGQP